MRKAPRAATLTLVTRSTIDIAHDLANALTAIRGSADSLKREIDANGSVARNVGRIIHSADEAIALTRELRASLHPEAGAELPWP
jgi:signal transduction histidine kinase